MSVLNLDIETTTTVPLYCANNKECGTISSYKIKPLFIWKEGYATKS